MRSLLLAGLVVVLGCGSPRPLGTFEPPFPDVLPRAPEAIATVGIDSSETETVAVPVPPPPVEPPAPPPPPVYLYTRTDEALRIAFADGLGGLLNGVASADQPRRVLPAEAHAWLDVLGRMNPAAVAFVRRQLGPVLAEDALAAYLLTDGNPAGCARLHGTLFLAVPEKDQGETRPYVGLIAHDTCGSGDLCLRCTAVGGPAVDGARARVCAPAPCGR